MLRPMDPSAEYSKAYEDFQTDLERVLAYMRFAVAGAGAEVKTRHPEIPFSPDELRRYVFETALVGVVAAFEAFLFEAIREILAHEPKLLKHRDMKIALDDQCFSLPNEKLKAYLAEKAIASLMRDRLSTVLDFLAKLTKHDEDFSFDKDRMGLLNRAIEVRHVFVHRRGILNQQSIDRIGKKGLKGGTRYELEFDELQEYMHLILSLAVELNYRTPTATSVGLTRALNRRLEALKSQLPKK
jgi:hypothetical protein